MENINNKDRLQIIKNNKLIVNICADDENLFSFDTIPINNVTSKNHVLPIDTILWHTRLGHYDNKNIHNFVIEHLKLHNSKNCHQCKISKLKKRPFYNNFNKYEKPMELVHTDDVGKLENSFNDFNYYVTFLDDFFQKMLGFSY